jgi:zinc transport system substrate-binding protein
MTARWVAVAMVGLLVPSTACSGEDPGEGLVVVGSFYPLAHAARSVAGDHATVVDLTPPGAEPHDLELSPDDVDLLLDADVVLYLGSGFQPAVEAVVEDREGPGAVDLLDAVADLVQDEERDPHVWLDPLAMGAIVGAATDAMAAAQPADREAFTDGASTAAEELDRLHRGFEDGLSNCDRDLIVTAHDAFGHLARRYGFRQIPITGVSPESEPDPRRLAEVADLVRREGVTTIFTEELVSPEVAAALADEAGVRTAVLSPIEGLTEEHAAAGKDYVSLMQENLRKLREALGCG